MPYWIDHPEHGAHVCYSPEEVKEHEKVGWALRDPQPGTLMHRGPPPDPQPIPNATSPAPVELLAKRKPGRPKKAE